MTRDSALWTVTLIASAAVFLGSHFELLVRALPGLSDVWQARIELVAAVAGFVSGYLKMSPLALSPQNVMASATADRTLNPLSQPPQEKACS